MTKTLNRPGPWALALLLAASGCDCGPSTQRRSPSLEEGRTSVDFGQVQLDVEHQQALRIYNAGAVTLTLSELSVRPPFGIVEEIPLAVEVGQEIFLTLTFTPTVKDKRELADLVIGSDDPERPTVRVSLSGTGVQAVASASPSPLAFGEVWVGESNSVALRITNGGSNELKILDAAWLPETPDTVTANLAPISVNIPPGGQTQTQVRFAPGQMVESVPGGIRLELLPEQGGELVVTFTGRGIRAIPRLCFQLAGAGFETCTDPNAQGGTGNSLTVNLPPLCDSQVSPPDAGFDPCQGTPYEMKGQFHVRNEGNAPVRYAMQYRAATGVACDGGVPLPDFHFSNAPGPTALEWTDPEVALPAQGESLPVELAYRPTAECVDAASDQARIVWTRQGDTRQPIGLLAFITGQSKLPYAVSAPNSAIGVAPISLPFYGAANNGSAEFLVTGVELKWLVAPTEEGSCSGLDAGYPFTSCNGFETDPNSWCSAFAWAQDGGNPNDRPLAQRVIPVGQDGGVGQRQIGTLLFAHDPANRPPVNRPVCVYGVVQTTDPFRKEIISRMRGIREMDP